MACVTYAVKDLCFAFNMFIFGIKRRREFIKKYLETVGDDTSDEYVDEVILETEYFNMVVTMFNFSWC